MESYNKEDSVVRRRQEEWWEQVTAVRDPPDDWGVLRPGTVSTCLALPSSSSPDTS